MKKLYYAVLVSLISLPSVASALVTGGSGTQNITSLLDNFGSLLRKLIPILYGLGVIVFVWGLVTALWKGQESDDARAQGIKFAGFGAVLIFAAVALPGLVDLLSNSLNTPTGGTIKAPTVTF